MPEQIFVRTGTREIGDLTLDNGRASFALIRIIFPECDKITWASAHDEWTAHFIKKPVA